jgi:hypothetical protein
MRSGARTAARANALNDADMVILCLPDAGGSGDEIVNPMCG